MLSRDELRTMKVETAGDAPEVNSGTATNSAALANGARAAVNAHGWAVVAVDGRPALGRSHPLTVEGDDVGAFELNFACGEQGRDYIVTYVEQRRGNEAGHAPAVLSEVEISLAGKPCSSRSWRRARATTGSVLIASACAVPVPFERRSMMRWSRQTTRSTACDSD